ncbi:DUF4328 domain-containing protein [Nakamurella lactea]|uniref:DUF4328 domain-containing protein n=1 Tax=Nakamurella lactea TaxID=459515 RepID=UPI000568B9A3|nr:DUF4328 domain-containing protein [Nakamurella lactea]
MSRPAPAARRTDVRCPRCARTQPPLPAGVFHCLYCGTPLPLQRWVAHPPPGVPDTRPRRLGRRPGYTGPPAYRGGHPRWGFPPTLWRWVDPPDPDAAVTPPVTALRSAAFAAVVTAVVCVLAGLAEIRRFVLMLRGRTDVLSGSDVRVSDALVTLASWTALVCAVVTAAIAVPAICRAHRAAAVRAGKTESRDLRSMLLRLLVPVWNIYGAGQVVSEVDGLLSGAVTESGRPRPSARALGWWACWILSSVLTSVVLARGLGASLQAIADTVELHVAVDLAAALVAVATAVLMLSWVRLFVGPRPGRYASWRVAGPAPSRARITDGAAAARRSSGVLPPTAAEAAELLAAEPGSAAPERAVDSDG